MDEKKIKQKILAKLQREVGLYLPNDVYAQIDKIAGCIVDEEDKESYEGTIRDFLQVIQIAATSNYFPKPKALQHQRSKRYEKPFKRRLHIVDFVISKQLSKEKPLSKKRINWKSTTEEWNKENPHDFMNNKDLKFAYYQAISQADIQEAFFKQKHPEIAIKFAEFTGSFPTTIESIRNISFEDVINYINKRYKDTDLAKKLMSLYGFKYEVSPSDKKLD